MAHEALRQELLELHFGCHPDPEPLQARLAVDLELQRLQRQVLAEANLLERAARLPVAEFALPVPARVSLWRRLVPMRLRVAAAALLLATLGISAPWAWSCWQQHRAYAATPVLTCSLPSVLAPGVGWQLAVDCRDANRQPLAAEVSWQTVDGDGKPMADGVAAVRGDGTVAMPAALPPPRRLRVQAQVLGQTIEHTFELGLLAAPPLVHLDTDQPVCKPGEPSRLRAVVLDRVTLAPEQHDRLAVDVVDPRGSVVFSGSCAAEAHGVHTAVWPIPAPIAGGRYTWRVRRNAVSLAELPLLVADFRPGQLRTGLTLDRLVVRPGQRARVEVHSERLTGGAVGGGEVVGEVLVDGRSCWRGQQRLDAEGRCQFAFDLPADVAPGSGRFVATVADGAVREAEVVPFTVPGAALRARLCPEGGGLVAGVANRVFAEILDDVGRGVATQAWVVDDAGARIAPVRTDRHGRGQTTFTPLAGRQYELLLVEHGGQRIAAPMAAAGAVALRVEPAVLPSGALLRGVLAGGPTGPWLVGVFCRGVLLAQQPVLAAGEFALELPTSATGVLQVTVFDGKLTPVAERLVLREGRRLQVDLAMAAEVLPGGDQEIAVATRDAATGEPVAAAVGISVFDRARQRLQPRPWRGIVDDAWLFADLDGDDDLWAWSEAERPAMLELLLGTRGWRQIVESGAERPLPAHAQRVADVAPLAWTSPGGSELAAADRATHRHRNLALTGYAWIVLLGVLVLCAEAGIRLVRWCGGRGVAADVSAAIAGVASAGLALFLFQGQVAEPAPASAVLRSVSFDATSLDWRFEGEVPEASPDGGVWSGRVDTFRSAPFPTRGGERTDPDDQPTFDGADPWPEVIATPGRVVDADPALHFPVVATDAHGRAKVRLTAGQRVTGWTVRASAHGGGALGQSEGAFATIRPLAIEARLPIAAVAGDELQIPIAVRGPATAGTALVHAAASGAVQLGAPTLRIDLHEGRGRALLPLTMIAAGPVELRLSARCGELTDATIQRLQVLPAGFPQTQALAGTLTKAHEFEVTIPDDALTPIATLRFFPSPVTQIAEALEGLLQEPHGCFEQTSSTNYPNTLVLTLLDGSGDDLPVAPAAASRARELLARGLARLRSFECQNGGFDWFGREPAHMALTAYGLLQFADMAAVTEIDPGLLTRTRAWLLARRDGNGGFVPDGAGHSFGRAPAALVDAYVLHALLRGGVAATDVTRELDQVAARAATTTDPYELAVASCALGAGKHPGAANARRRLLDLRRADSTLPKAATGIVGSRGRDLEVETMSWATLAWLQAPAHHGDAAAAIQWLLGQRQASGSFGATQATVMALKAIVADLQVHRRGSGGGGRVVVRIDGQEAGVVPLHRHATEPAVLDLARLLPTGSHRVSLQLADGGAVPWQLAVEYRSVQPANDSSAAVAVQAEFAAASVREGEAVGLRIVITNTGTEPAAMPVAIVGLPAGVEVAPAELDEAVRREQIAFWEMRGQELCCYLRGLLPGERRELHCVAVGAVPGRAVGAAPRAFAYYTPGKRFGPPLQLTVTAR